MPTGTAEGKAETATTVAVPSRRVAAEEADVHVDHPGDFGGDRGEHLFRGRTVGDQRGHPAQRGLLVGDPAELLAGIGVGDRGRGQFGEVGQPPFGSRRGRLPGRRARDHEAPQAAIDGNRRCDSGADTELTHHRRDRRTGRKIVDASWTPGRPDKRGRAAFGERAVVAGPRGFAGRAPRGDARHRMVGVVPGQERAVGLQNPPDLFGHGREHLRRRCAAGDQRRHPAQRGLLAGESRALARTRFRRIPHTPIMPADSEEVALLPYALSSRSRQASASACSSACGASALALTGHIIQPCADSVGHSRCAQCRHR